MTKPTPTMCQLCKNNEATVHLTNTENPTDTNDYCDLCWQTVSMDIKLR